MITLPLPCFWLNQITSQLGGGVVTTFSLYFYVLFRYILLQKKMSETFAEIYLYRQLKWWYLNFTKSTGCIFLIPTWLSGNYLACVVFLKKQLFFMSDGHNFNKKIIELDHMYTFIGHNLYTWSHLSVKIINTMYRYEVVSVTDLFLQQYGFTWKFCELQSHAPCRALQRSYGSTLIRANMICLDIPC